MDIKPLDTEQIGLKTLEKHLIRSKSEVSLKIGLPKEISNDERRVTLTPGGVSILKANGHEIFIEKGAGENANFSDREYADAGAEIAYSPDDVFKKSDLILKIAPLAQEEFELLQPDQALISALHMGSQTEQYLEAVTEKSITGIGYEFIRGDDKEFPIVRMMHEITGSMSVQIAAHYLESMSGGQGIMLGGISGVPPATVVILGAGITGEYAARTALGYGAQVFVMDTDLAALRRLENALDRRIITAVANHQYLNTALKFADIIIGAAMAEGERSPCWVTDEMVAGMKPGSVIVDTVIDQGGCVATSRPTTHSDPVYTKHDVIHHCVPNIPANVPRTATYALNNVLVPYILAIGNAGGVKECLWENVALRNGTYSYKKHITKKSLAKMFDMPYREIEMLIASQI
ncbi:MAG: alanine dehydrogenase [Balneola sp.]|jgi:alanine dehydrogenase|nr:alanine dehydrogenase [Balneola sp.]MBE80613.1 alanine dehydrogenase [Balneola sp.]MBE80665.1 alanine dehydrogenase [Balneola sp.]|tara:strand:+ start:76 stop:1290 length:1215 start_codon:yes stop_codon:yes gene_type:complete